MLSAQDSTMELSEVELLTDMKYLPDMKYMKDRNYHNRALSNSMASLATRNGRRDQDQDPTNLVAAPMVAIANRKRLQHQDEDHQNMSVPMVAMVSRMRPQDQDKGSVAFPHESEPFASGRGYEGQNYGHMAVAKEMLPVATRIRGLAQSEGIIGLPPAPGPETAAGSFSSRHQALVDSACPNSA
jgi:hypothetical protein